MAAFRAGDSGAAARLVDLLYPELVKIKALIPTDADRPNDKAAFFALAGQIMKRLLIHHARPLAQKAEKIPIWDDLRVESDNSLIEVEEVLSRLEAIKPIIRTVVELKVFEGRTSEEIAQQLGVATVTVHRHWQFARHWMRSEWTE